MSLTPAQLEMRRSGIGASECSAAVGMSKYKQTVELWLEKTGQRERDDLSANFRVLLGQGLESRGIEYWSSCRGIPVQYPMDTVRHPEHYWMLCTPDAQIDDRRGLEFKTMGLHRWRHVQEVGIASALPEYMLQCQHQIAVMGWEENVLGVLVIRNLEKLIESLLCGRVDFDDFELHDIPVPRNERLINLLIDREREFWGHVERREPPPIDFSKEGALRAVQAMHPDVKTGDVVRLDEEDQAFWDANENLGSATDLKRKKDAFKAPIAAKIGDNFGGLLPDGRIVYRCQVERSGYYVKPTSFEYLKARRYDGETIIEPDDDDDPDDDLDPSDAIDLRLRESGFYLVDTSPSGSRYYIHQSEPVRVRLADHDPNEATSAWMERQGIVREIRLDRDPWADLDSVLGAVSEGAGI